MIAPVKRRGSQFRTIDGQQIILCGECIAKSPEAAVHNFLNYANLRQHRKRHHPRCLLVTLNELQPGLETQTDAIATTSTLAEELIAMQLKLNGARLTSISIDTSSTLEDLKLALYDFTIIALRPDTAMPDLYWQAVQRLHTGDMQIRWVLVNILDTDLTLNFSTLLEEIQGTVDATYITEVYSMIDIKRF